MNIEQEKAKELVSIFYSITGNIQYAQECAKFAVDLILNVTFERNNEYYFYILVNVKKTYEVKV